MATEDSDFAAYEFFMGEISKTKTKPNVNEQELLQFLKDNFKDIEKRIYSRKNPKDIWMGELYSILGNNKLEILKFLLDNNKISNHILIEYIKQHSKYWYMSQNSATQYLEGWLKIYKLKNM